MDAPAAVSDRIACLNVTLHYHDVPEHMPADLMYQLFACDIEAFGLENRVKARAAAVSASRPSPSHG